MISGSIDYKALYLSRSTFNFIPGRFSLRIFLEEGAVILSATRRQDWQQAQLHRTPAWFFNTGQRGDQQDSNGTQELSLTANSYPSWSGEIWGQRPDFSALSLLLASYNSLVCCAEAAPTC
jgi:hypothetical protein